MRDDMQGGILATLIAAPVMIVCCGGGGILLAAITGAIGGWVIGLGGLSAVLVIVAAALALRSIRRARRACPMPGSDRDRGADATDDKTPMQARKGI
jgi:hypothetical protein